MATSQFHPPLRILIVEDHPIISHMLELTLKSLGQIVIGVAADLTGFRRHDISDIDLAIVDLNLTDGPTGLSIATEISYRGIAVVFHTTDPGRITVSLPNALGVLEKPFALDKLVDFIHSAERHRDRSRVLDMTLLRGNGAASPPGDDSSAL